MDPIEWLKNWARTEWSEVKRAPFAFISTALLAGVVAYLAASAMYSERIAVLQERIALIGERVGDSPARPQTVSGAAGVIAKWGRDAPDQCEAEIDGSGLMKYSADYYAILVCGLATRDDRLAGTNITISQPYNIQPRFAIGGPATEQFRKLVDAATNTVMEFSVGGGEVPKAMFTLQLTIWYEVGLIPKGVEAQMIKTLADFRRVGGMHLHDEARTVLVTRPMPSPQ